MIKDIKLDKKNAHLNNSVHSKISKFSYKGNIDIISSSIIEQVSCDFLYQELDPNTDDEYEKRLEDYFSFIKEITDKTGLQ